MKNTHFSNRDSLNDAMKNLGLKHSDIDMSNKRMPANMSVEDIIEKPMHFKKGGKVMGVSIAIMPAHKMNRMKKPCMNTGGMVESDGTMYSKGGMVPKGNMYKKGGMAPMPADKMHRLKMAKPSSKRGGGAYAEGGLCDVKSVSSSSIMSKALRRSTDK
jgi:hypothetical protein